MPRKANTGYAASAAEIDAKVDATLRDFYAKIGAGEILARKAKGIRMFPSVIKPGFWVGGQYGEGVFRVGGKNVNYYSIARFSIRSTGKIDRKAFHDE
jgi:lipid-binding SYLF domain-containing protein